MTARRNCLCLALLFGLAQAHAARGDDFSMNVKADGIRLGGHLLGPKVALDDLKGRVILLEFWGVN